MFKRSTQFAVEMCKTWGALVTGGFIIGIIGIWGLTGHAIPPRMGWAILMAGIIGAAFQVWNRQVSLTDQSRDGLHQERANHAKAIAVLNGELENSRVLNNPYLTFNVDTVMKGMLCEINLTVGNAGQFPTKILEGQMELKSSLYPAVHEAFNLAGIELAGKGHRTITMTVKRPLLHTDQNSGPQPAELCITTFYTQPRGSGAQNTKYLYIHQTRRFEPAK